jgi:hypothetical protein
MAAAARTRRPGARDYTVLALARRHPILFSKLLAAKEAYHHAHV